MTPPILATARLRLRPRSLDDLDANLAMDLDPEVVRYVWGEPPEATAHRAELAVRIASGWPDEGGIWAVEWKDRPGFLGWTGLFPLDGGEEIEIGYRFVRAAWGMGLATEAGSAVMAHGFECRGLARIVAVADPDNHASHRVLRKLGLQPCGRGWHYGRELCVFRKDRQRG